MSAAVEAAKAGASRGTECWPNRSASQAHQARSGFAEQALATIETASRRAAADTRRGDRGRRRQAAAGRGRVQPGRLPV